MAFARIRHLRRRSTYLIINMTVADLLVGALTVSLFVFREDQNFKVFTWSTFIKLIAVFAFPLASQVNLCLISLERLHATLFPFRHCLIFKWVYYKIIISSWCITLVMASLMSYLYFDSGFSYAWASFGLLTLLILTVSYVIIIVNVQSSRYSPPRGLIATERKLTVTLLIVTVFSVLTILPLALYNSMPVDIQDELSDVSRIAINDLAVAIYFACSIVNPLVYAIRLQEFKKAIRKLVAR